MDTENVVIIGSGPAGLTSAIYTARAGLNPLVIAGLEFGGQLMTTTSVENYPGFIDGVQGPDLMQNMLKQAEKFGAKIIYEDAKSVNFSAPEKQITLQSGKIINSKSVIIATGAKPRKLGIPGEQKYWGRGVSSCATCDGALYKDKYIAVVGGGDSAVEEATFLTRFANTVYLIHRNSKLKASKIMQERLFANKKISIIWDSKILEVLGENEIVSGLKIENIKTHDITDLKLSGLFLGIGHIPNTELFKGILEQDKDGYLIVKENTKTSIQGVFVAGDVKDSSYRQAVTAAGMGCMAALDAEKFLRETNS